MKAFIISLTLSSMSMSAFGAPQTSSEKYFNEGTETTLTKEQVQEIKPWAQNTRALLLKLLENARNLTYTEKTNTLIRGIRQGVLASAPHNTELSMRYILNRANKVYKIMRTSPHANEPMAVDAQNRLLQEAVEMAIRYYQSDMQALNKAKNGEAFNTLTFKFAVDCQNLLNSLSQFNFDPIVNYKIQYLRVSYFQLDLFRLKDNKTYANAILETRRLTKFYPKNPPHNHQKANKLQQKLSTEFNKLLKQINIMSDPYKGDSISYIQSQIKVGDEIYVSDYSDKKIIASISKDKKKYTVEDTSDSRKGYYPIESIYLTKGCLRGFCVGDRVYQYYGNSSSTIYITKILAINFYREKYIYNAYPVLYSYGVDSLNRAEKVK